MRSLFRHLPLRNRLHSFKPKKEKKGGKADSPRTAELRKIRETRPLTPAESREWRAHFNPVSPETKLKAIEEGKRFILAGLNHLARFECTPDEMQDICAECLGEIEFDLGECVTVDNLTTHSAPNYVPTLEERVAELERRANAVQQILQEHGLA